MPEPDELSLFVRRLEAAGSAYMITGATAAILYGQPRVTNDLDVVLALGASALRPLLAAFPESEFYVPPETVIQTEMARTQRGHFKLIHLESGYKADVYLAGTDPLHAWALERRRRMRTLREQEMWVAPPEYVVLRKLEFYREGRSSKHVSDIQAITQITGVDPAVMSHWLPRLGLQGIWREASAGDHSSPA